MTKYIWKTLSSNHRQNSDRLNIKLKVNNDITSDPSKVSEASNNYFSSLTSNLVSNIPPSSLNQIEKN